jgi:thiamine-monophosphate kinase
MTAPRADVLLGIGDDCALLAPQAGEALAVTTDTLIAGRHFPEDAAAFDVGWKSLAVNLSDLAAMGAQPRWFTLALSLPEVNESWLQGFADGLRALATASSIALVGGDTTRGPLVITITALGTMPAPLAVRRSGARPGDAVCVTGTLGDAALGLRFWQERTVAKEGPGKGEFAADLEQLYARLHRPQPRVGAGLLLREVAHAAIDLSDGLAGDLGHILDASGVGAEIRVDRLPASAAFERWHPQKDRLALQVANGDDYELCVCLPAERVAEVRARLDVPLTEIGRVTAEKGLRWYDASGRQLDIDLTGYRHFQ